jgi:hypothetical protein
MGSSSIKQTGKVCGRLQNQVFFIRLFIYDKCFMKVVVGGRGKFLSTSIMVFFFVLKEFEKRKK